MSTRSHPESARIIREARQAAGLTQLELAEKLGVTIGTISYMSEAPGCPKQIISLHSATSCTSDPPTSCAPIHKPNALASVSTSGGVRARPYMALSQIFQELQQVLTGLHIPFIAVKISFSENDKAIFGVEIRQAFLVFTL